MNHKKSIPIFLLVILIIAQLIVMSVFSRQKVGYHMDEVLSYLLSNSTKVSEKYGWAIDKRAGLWSDKAYFNNKLSVHEDHKFDYDSTYFNQTTDVHPPVYYFALHTICSLMPGSFSKWIGILLNMLFSVATTVVLFLLGRKLLKNVYLSLIGCALWTLSCGAVNMVTYIRMYSMVIFFTVSFFYLLISILLETSKRKHNLYYLGIVAVLFLGALTHYYFIIFAFFSVATLLIILLIRKQFWECLKLSLSALIPLGLAVAYYPAMIEHIFYGYRGEEAFSNFESTSGFDGLRAIFSVINQAIFSNLGKILAISLVALLCYALIKNKLKITGEQIALFSMLAFPIGFYILVISKVAPFQNDRYFSPIMPLILFFFVAVAYALLKAVCNNKKIVLSILATVSTVIILGGLVFMPKNYLYPEVKESFEFAENNNTLPAIVYSDVYINSYKIYYELSNYPAAFIYRKDSPEADLVQAEQLKNASSVVLYIDKQLDEGRYLEHAKKSTGFKAHSFCFDNPQYGVYLLQK